ncbi:MAG: hypothetical protein RI894_191 [Bacteroidota bacterium]|jgi:hypothetical protein
MKKVPKLSLLLHETTYQRMKIGGFVFALFLAVFLALFLAFMSFKDNALSPTAYIKWLEDPKNGLLIKGLTDDKKFMLKMQYMPNEVLAYQILTPAQRASISKGAWDSLVNSYHQVDYYKLDISSTSLKDPLAANTKVKEQYYDKLNYLTFDMQKNVRMVCGSDTLPCVLYNYERMYNTTNFCRILLAFDTEKVKATTNRQLLILDNQLGIDTVGFSFAGNRLQHIPTLRVH